MFDPKTADPLTLPESGGEPRHSTGASNLTTYHWFQVSTFEPGYRRMHRHRWVEMDHFGQGGTGFAVCSCGAMGSVHDMRQLRFAAAAFLLGLAIGYGVSR